MIGEALEKELQERLSKAGVVVSEARLTHLAYAPEIASVMLRRQQAEAIIAARKKIVHGAVSMVEMALAELSEKKVIDLDEERKAAMVGNLLVVLCGEAQVEPVINTGSPKALSPTDLASAPSAFKRLRSLQEKNPGRLRVFCPA